jgi:hypothetical protein
MRVSELLATLHKLDPSLELLAHAAHGECRFQFFDIEAVDVSRAVRSRDESGMHRATIDEENGRPLAILTLTSDF